MKSEPQPTHLLTTWKAIADYLGVTPRTAQLWERHRGLPVRRLPGGTSRVSAFVSELDAWRNSGPPPRAKEIAGRKTGAATGRTLFNGAGRRARFRWQWIAAGSVLVIVALATFYWYSQRPGPAALWRVELNTLTVTDANGRQLWSKTFPERLLRYDVSTSVSVQDAVWIGDLDDDGEQEILFDELFSHNGIEQGQLICFSASGTPEWQFTPGRAVSSRSDDFTPYFRPVAFVVGSKQLGAGHPIVVASLHEQYYPAQVALLSPQGAVLRQYWHSGPIGSGNLKMADWDGNGREEICLGGVSAADQSPTLVVLDPETLDGASVESNPDFQLRGFKAGIELARIIFPPSCISRHRYPSRQQLALRVSPNLISVQVTESEDETLAPSLIYSIGPGFRLMGLTAPNSFRAAHNNMFYSGKLDHLFDERELEDLRRIRTLTSSPALARKD